MVRVKSGMENAKSKGKRIGKPQTTKEEISTVFYKHYPAFVAGTMNLTELAWGVRAIKTDGV